jgi:hypothetical protein
MQFSLNYSQELSTAFTKNILYCIVDIVSGPDFPDTSSESRISIGHSL